MRTEKEIKDKKGGLLSYIKKNEIKATMGDEIEDEDENEDMIRSNPDTIIPCGYDAFKMYQNALKRLRIKKK